MRAWARVCVRLSGRAHAVLEASDLVAHVLGVGADGGRGDALHVVGQVGARAHAAGAVFGAWVLKFSHPDGAGPRGMLLQCVNSFLNCDAREECLKVSSCNPCAFLQQASMNRWVLETAYCS